MDIQLRVSNWRSLDESSRNQILKRPTRKIENQLRTGVADILAGIRDRGDLALHTYISRFDSSRVDNVKVSKQEIDESFSKIPGQLLKALEQAATNITNYHAAQLRDEPAVDVAPGIKCRRLVRPICAVGLYVPGGSAPLLSTALMLGIPAKIAGCPRVVMATPPRTDGTIDPGILAAARLAGVTEIYKMGGAQAIAAMAYGTETVTKVDKIFGPGNAWVTEAKLQVSCDPRGAAIDLPAGPSEVMVVADRSCIPEFVAADLLAQAEHGPDSQCILVCTEQQIARAVQQEIELQIADLPRRKIAEEALSVSSIILVEDRADLIEVINRYGPEHLLLQVDDAEGLTDSVVNAGSIFLGNWTPEAAGDYASGPNHVIPTDGWTRAYSALGVSAFLRVISVQDIGVGALIRLAPTIETLAQAEGLIAHKNAVSVRVAKYLAGKLINRRDDADE